MTNASACMAIDFPEDLECAVCLDSWKQPRELMPCGHIYCLECLPMLSGDECAVCREGFQMIKVPNRTLVNMALNLKVECQLCGWTGKREVSVQHTCLPEDQKKRAADTAPSAVMRSRMSSTRRTRVTTETRIGTGVVRTTRTTPLFLADALHATASARPFFEAAEGAACETEKKAAVMPAAVTCAAAASSAGCGWASPRHAAPRVLSTPCQERLPIPESPSRTRRISPAEEEDAVEAFCLSGSPLQPARSPGSPSTSNYVDPRGVYGGALWNTNENNRSHHRRGSSPGGPIEVEAPPPASPVAAEKRQSGRAMMTTEESSTEEGVEVARRDVSLQRLHASERQPWRARSHATPVPFYWMNQRK